MNELTLRLVKITTHSHYSLNAHTSIIVSSLSFLLCCQKTNPKNSRACNSPLSSRNSYIQLKPTRTEAHCIVLSRCFVEFGFVCFTFVLFDSWQLTGFLGACFPNHRTDFFSLLKTCCLLPSILFRLDSGQTVFSSQPVYLCDECVCCGKS